MLLTGKLKKTDAANLKMETEYVGNIQLVVASVEKERVDVSDR